MSTESNLCVTLLEGIIDTLSEWFGTEDIPDSPRRPSAWTRSATVALDLASFQARLVPDVASLRNAINLANRVGVDGLIVTRSFLSERSHWIDPIVQWANSGKQCKFESPELEKSILRELLEVFIRGGFFDREGAMEATVSTVARWGSTMQMKMIVALMDTRRQTMLSVHNTNHPTHFVGVVNAIRYLPESDEALICELIKRSSDDHLNMVYTDATVHHGYISVWTVAVIYERLRVIRALLERFPGVNFEMTQTEHPPTAASLISCVGPAAKSYRQIEVHALLKTGEELALSYHRRASRRISETLKDVLLPELVILVDAYAARTPFFKCDRVLKLTHPHDTP